MNRKRIGFILILALLVMIILSGCDKYRNVKSTNLSGEGLNGIVLGSKYDEQNAEKTFGKLFHTEGDSKKKTYAFYSDIYHVSITTDSNMKIIILSSQWLLNLTGKVSTKKGISNNSSLDDIVKAYGINYSRENHYNQMGGGDYYDMLYIDKEHKIMLDFKFDRDTNDHSDITLSFI